MPKATLTYDLADSDEAGQHRLAISAIHLSAALQRIDQYCRSKIKYCELDEATVAVLKEIRAMMPDDMWEY